MRSKRIIKNIFSSLILQLITIICGFIVPKLIITYYGSNVNGLVVSITQFLAYITLLESGIGPVIKSKLYKPIAKKDKQEIENILYSSESFFKVIAKVFLIYIFILCFVYPKIISSQFETLFTITLILIISISTFVEYYFGITYTLYLQAKQKNYITSYLQIITIILNTIGICILIKFGANILLVKLLSSILFVIRPLVQNYYVKKKYAIHLKNANHNYVLTQKWNGLAQHVAAVIHGNTDIVVLTIFTTISEVSVYSIYLLVINGVKRVISSFIGGIDAAFGDMIAKEEIDTLRKSFNMYEFIYFTIITIIYICTFILIIPFVKIYTNKITDVNYVRPVFAIIIVFAEFMYSIRLPYSSLTLAAGHFKETMKGAWIESLVNIIVSIILVFHFGIIGVAIGTLIAMVIRTIEFVIHTSNFILKRKLKKAVFKILVCLIEVLTVISIFYFIPIKIDSYLSWICYAIITFVISLSFVILINILLFKEPFTNVKNMLKNIKNNKNDSI